MTFNQLLNKIGRTLVLATAFQCAAAPAKSDPPQAVQQRAQEQAAISALIKQARPRLQTHILINAADGDVLESDKGDAVIHPASVTKLMTAYIVFEELRKGKTDPKGMKLNSRLKVSLEAARGGKAFGGTNLNLEKCDREIVTTRSKGKKRKIAICKHNGELGVLTMTPDQLLRGLLVHSANDAAIILAENISGSEKAFVSRMNATAKKLEMTDSNFTTPNGFPDRRQVSTAHDLAKLSQALIRDFPEYYYFFSTLTFTFNNGTETKSYQNYNNLLGRVQGVDGLKTGYINMSGFNLAASMRCDDGNRVIAVVTGAPNAAVRKTKMTRLLEFGCDKLENPSLVFSPSRVSEAEKVPLYRTLYPKMEDESEPTDAPQLIEETIDPTPAEAPKPAASSPSSPL